MQQLGLLLALLVPTAALGEGGVQILGHATGGFCECPVVEEGRSCEELTADVPDHTHGSRAQLFLEGLDHVREVRFGIRFDPPHHLPGWGVCAGGFIDDVTFVGPEAGYSVLLTAMDECHTITDGLHFLICLDFLSAFEQPTTVIIAPDPGIGVAQATNCSGAVFPIAESSLAEIGYGTTGHNPCKDTTDVPTIGASWSRMKTRF